MICRNIFTYFGLQPCCWSVFDAVWHYLFRRSNFQNFTGHITWIVEIFSLILVITMLFVGFWCSYIPLVSHTSDIKTYTAKHRGFVEIFSPGWVKTMLFVGIWLRMTLLVSHSSDIRTFIAKQRGFVEIFSPCRVITMSFVGIDAVWPWWLVIATIFGHIQVM